MVLGDRSSAGLEAGGLVGGSAGYDAAEEPPDRGVRGGSAGLERRGQRVDLAVFPDRSRRTGWRGPG